MVLEPVRRDPGWADVYMLTKWHVLEYVREMEANETKPTIYGIKTFFRVDHGRIRNQVNNLHASQYLTSEEEQRGKRTIKHWKLTNKAQNHLDTYGLDFFTEKGNKPLKGMKERAIKMDKDMWYGPF